MVQVSICEAQLIKCLHDNNLFPIKITLERNIKLSNALTKCHTEILY